MTAQAASANGLPKQGALPELARAAFGSTSAKRAWHCVRHLDDCPGSRNPVHMAGTADVDVARIRGGPASPVRREALRALTVSLQTVLIVEDEPPDRP